MSNLQKHQLGCKINQNKQFTVSEIQQSLSIAKSSFYYQSHRSLTRKLNQEDKIWLARIEQILAKRPSYGYRMITAKLNQQYSVNHKRIQRILAISGLNARPKPEKFKPAGKMDKHYKNLIRELTANQPNQIWMSDMTLIWSLIGWLYLFAIKDIFTKKIVGWNLSEHPDAESAKQALIMAIARQSKLFRNLNFKELELIHHSDQGSPYRALLYTNCLKQNNIQISMSRKATPSDQPDIESFFKTLKLDEVYQNEYQDHNHAHQNINNYIENDYNTDRPHSSIKYQAPVQFEKQFIEN